MEKALLTTKLYCPALRPGLVPRPRLVAQLQAGLQTQPSVIVISAPAGFGKSTLVAEWLNDLRRPPATSGNLQVAWLSLDAEDNDPARFLTYLIAALQTVQADTGAAALSLFHSPQPPPLTTVLAMLIHDLAPAPAIMAAVPALILVLDDYHLIEAPAVHDLLNYLLDHLPPSLHLVIASRADPFGLPLARLRARGQLVELRAADLSFTLAETETFFNVTMGLDLSRQNVAALEARTEGWIAALQLAALSLRQRTGQDLTNFIATFNSSHRHLIDYLAEEVMARQPAERRDFLYQTSILNRLTGSLCEAVTGRPDSEALLRQVEQANLFLLPLDDQRYWYRYHHLFADFLRSSLCQRLPAQLPDLHRRASAWYARHGWLTEAIEHALAAGEMERAAELIEQTAGIAGQILTLPAWQRWLSALPEAVLVVHPRLGVYYTLTLIMSGQPLPVIEACLQRTILADSAGSVAAEIMLLQALIAIQQGDMARSGELSPRGLALLPPDSHLFRGFVAGYLGMIHLEEGNVTVAVQAAELVAQIDPSASHLILAELAILQGRLDQARDLYESILAPGSPGQPLSAGMAHIGLGRLFYQWNDLVAAERHLTQGIDLTREWWENGALGAYLALAWLKQAQGDIAAADTLMGTAWRLVGESTTMKLLASVVGAQQVCLWLEQGKLEPARAWVAGRDLTLATLTRAVQRGALSLHQAVEAGALARLSLAQGQPDLTLEVVELLLPVARQSGWTGLVIELLLLQALAGQARGHLAGALIALEQALTLAQPAGYTRLFVEGGAPTAQLLHQAATRGIRPDYVARLLAAFRPEPGPPVEASPSPSPLQPLLDPLSEREVEVLRLLSAGLSNQEMADHLVVAVSTVRTHLNNIYRKLDVSSRTQALARARSLNLL